MPTILVLTAILLASCGRTDRHEEVMDMISSANNMSEEMVLSVDPDFYHGQSKLELEGDPDRGQAAQGSGIPRHMIRTGEYRFKVADLDTARQRIQALVGAMKGYVQGEEVSDWGDRTALIMRIRVPAPRFDATVSGIERLGVLEQRTVRVADVTSEVVDLEARLGAKRILEVRYGELVQQAGKVSELLEVERELGKVRSEIESMEAEKRLMGDQVAMSTLTITCTVPTENDGSFFADASATFGTGWDLLLRTTVGLLSLWPFFLLGAAGIWLLRLRLKKRKSV
jgi:hypothetical protein